jgi:RNA polymerase sigma factor (sigma-70 family)
MQPPTPSDHDLLRRWHDQRDQAAFTQVAERYVNFVFATARRLTRDRHLAEDVAQAVFLILSRKAGRIRDGTVLSNWLFVTTRYAAANAIKAQVRRRKHQKRLIAMTDPNTTNVSDDPANDSSSNLDWEAVGPVLDSALAGLGRRDREAVLLKFVEGRTHGEVARVIGVSEEAARKRISRAVERLREFLASRGVTVSAAALGALLVEQTTQAAPPAVLASLGSAHSASTAAPALVQGTLNAMALAKVKLIGLGIAAVLVIAASGGVIYQHAKARSPVLAQSGPTKTSVPAQPASVQKPPAPADDSQPIEGIVHGLDAEPLPGAEIYLATPDRIINVYRPKEKVIRGPVKFDPAVLAQRNVALITENDGKFAFIPTKPPYSVIAIHPDGFAMATDEELARSKQLFIRPWMRVEGVLKDADQRPMPGEEIELSVRNYPEDPAENCVGHHRNTKTDANGRFVFDKVVPVDICLVRRQNVVHILHNTWTFVAAQPGKTIQVQMGATGRPTVVGRLVPPKGMEDQVSFKNGPSNVATLSVQRLVRVPGDFHKLSPREQVKWARSPERTAEERAALRMMAIWWEVPVAPDGTFRLDDLPPGQYSLDATVWEFDHPRMSAETVAQGRHMLEVPVQSTPGKGIDLGAIELTGRPRLKVGAAAPPFVFFSPDGKRRLTLADFKGKYLLLHVNRDPRITEAFLPDLKKAYESFSADQKLAMLTVHLRDASSVQQWIEDHPLPWPQGVVDSKREAGAELPEAYLGGSWQTCLIDPDGKVVIKSMRGDAVAGEIAKYFLERR